MLKLFVPETYPNLRRIPLLAPPLEDDHRLFQHINFSEYENIFEYASDVQEADAIILPHYLTDIAMYATYVAQIKNLASTSHKKLLVFTSQDNPEQLVSFNTVFIRPSAYASRLTPSEFVSPGIVEDMGSVYGWRPLKKGAIPSIGFVGKAEFDTPLSYIKYVLKNYVGRFGPNKQGVYFRRRAMRNLKYDEGIETHFVGRRRYGAHQDTVELAPEKTRAEYVESIKNSIFTLAPRGDGNYSLRFYETLSLGRIPVLIDTDMRLPFEESIPYSECILRVPYTQIDSIAEIIKMFWESHTEEELLSMQQRAREIFQTYLYYPNYLRKLFASPEFLNQLRYEEKV